MALVQRIENITIAQRRDYMTGALRVAVSVTAMIENHDSEAGAYEPMRETIATAVDPSEVAALVGEVLPALVAERDSLAAEVERLTEALEQMGSQDVAGG